jgi:hypothetical protein
VSRSVRIPGELDARLVAEAERLDRSVSWLIVRALDGTIGGATQKVATQAAKAAEKPEYEWKDLPPAPTKEQLAAEATIVPQAPRRAGSKTTQAIGLESFKCSVCGLRTVGGPCQKHPKSSEKVA